MPSIDWLIIFSYIRKRAKYCLNCANTSMSSLLIATKSWRWLVCEYGLPFWMEYALYNIAYVCKRISLTLWLLMDVDVIKVIIACMFCYSTDVVYASAENLIFQKNALNRRHGINGTLFRFIISFSVLQESRLKFGLSVTWSKCWL